MQTAQCASHSSVAFRVTFHSTLSKCEANVRLRIPTRRRSRNLHTQGKAPKGYGSAAPGSPDPVAWCPRHSASAAAEIVPPRIRSISATSIAATVIGVCMDRTFHRNGLARNFSNECNTKVKVCLKHVRQIHHLFNAFPSLFPSLG